MCKILHIGRPENVQEIEMCKKRCSGFVLSCKTMRKLLLSLEKMGLPLATIKGVLDYGWQAYGGYTGLAGAIHPLIWHSSLGPAVSAVLRFSDARKDGSN